MKVFDKLIAMGIEVDPDLEDQVNQEFKITGEKKPKVEPRFVRVKEFDATGHKMPNQARMLLAALGDEPVNYEEWGAAAADEGMGTKQDPARIAAYYRKTLEDLGAITRA